MTRRGPAIYRHPRWWKRQGPMITQWLAMMVMRMSGRPWRLDIRRPRWDTARPVESACLLELDTSQRRGPGPLPTLSTSTVASGWMMGPWWVMASVGPVRSSTALPTPWPVAFWPLGPGNTVGPGPSHHGHAGGHGLLLFTGPGRPAGKICLRSLILRPRTCDCLRSLSLGRPVTLTLGRRKLKGIYRCVYLDRIVHSVSLLGLLSCLRRSSRLAFAFLLDGFLLSLPGLRQPILADFTGRVFSAKRKALVQTTLLTTVVIVVASTIMRAARELELQLGGRRPITWLLFRHLVNKGMTAYGDGIKTTSWPKATSTNVHTWERLTSVVAATNYFRFDARICLGRPLGQCVFRLTSAHERGENQSGRQVDTVLCADADAHRAERGLNFIVWNFAWDRLASRLYAATATTFLMKSIYCMFHPQLTSNTCFQHRIGAVLTVP